MSKMGDLIIEIEDLFERNYTNEQIAVLLGVPLKFVDEVFSNYLQNEVEKSGL